MDKPIRIRAEDGNIYCLENVRLICENNVHLPVKMGLAILDALEAALSVPKREAMDRRYVFRDTLGNHGDGISAGKNIGFNDGLGAVREAAGVVEEAT